MPTVIDLQALGDAPGAMDAVAESLANGEAVGLPSECSYGIAVLATADPPEGVANRLGSAVLAVRDVATVHDLVGCVSTTAKRLMKRCWPGPLVLEFGGGDDDSPVSSLSAGVRRGVIRDGRLRVGMPRHPFVSGLLARVPGPVALFADLDGQCRPTTATELKTTHGSAMDILVDDGPVRYDQPPTSVFIEGDRWRVVDQGIPSQKVIQRMAGEVIVFICTGNTCRSPMAEGLCRRLLAERLGCAEDEVMDAGFTVLSAGLAAATGAPAAEEAIELLRGHRIDLQSHESQPATRDLLERADRIITMTRAHRDSIISQFPELDSRTQVLSPEGEDVSDPIGGGPAEYSACFTEISRHLEHLVSELLKGRTKVSGQ
jgi:protein-tyrosine phosphatase